MGTTFSTNCNIWYCVRTAKATFPCWKLLFLSSIFKQLLLKNCAVDFVEICNVCTKKVIIKAAKRIFNSDKICGSYCDFYFGVTFLEHTVGTYKVVQKCTKCTVTLQPFAVESRGFHQNAQKDHRLPVNAKSVSVD